MSNLWQQKLAFREYPHLRGVRIFGANPDIDSGETETVWADGGLYVWPLTADTVDVVSDDGSDTVDGSGAQTVTIEGLDANFQEVTETITMAGAVAVTTTQQFLRVHLAKVATAGAGGAAAGIITGTHTASGDTLLNMGAANQTKLGLYTVPAGWTAYLVKVMVDATRSGSSHAHADIHVRELGSVFRNRGTYSGSGSAGSSWSDLAVWLEIPEKSDIEIQATSFTANIGVETEFHMVLRKSGTQA